MSEKVLVAGVGMIPFTKPGASPSYAEMGAEAVRRALADAGIGYDLVQQAMSATCMAIPPAARPRCTKWA